MFCLFLRPTPCHVHRRSPPRSIKLHGLEAKLAFAHALALPAPGAAVAWVKAVRIDDADDDDDNDDNDDDDDDDDDDNEDDDDDSGDLQSSYSIHAGGSVSSCSPSVLQIHATCVGQERC